MKRVNHNALLAPDITEEANQLKIFKTRKAIDN